MGRVRPWILISGDTLVSTGHLEVHIAEEILEALDVGEYDEVIIGISRHQSAGDTCDLLLERYTCCHECHT